MNRAAIAGLLFSALSASAYAQSGVFSAPQPADILQRFKASHDRPALEAGAGPVAVSPAFPLRGDPGTFSGRFDSEPNWNLTPGVLCTRKDKDFKEYRYSERIPYCKRNLSREEKQVVARRYGVPWGEHGKYQFDHLLSLCLGGSNHLKNIWPMPWDEARAKAKLENDLCIRLKEGRITQKAAVKEELGWFAENVPAALEAFRALFSE